MKYLTAAVAACALTLAPSAQADPGQADLESPFSTAGHPFVGTWGAHGERVVVSADGTGTETYGGGAMSFTLGSVPKAQPHTASGNITGGGKSASEPEARPSGVAMSREIRLIDESCKSYAARRLRRDGCAVGW